MKQLATTVIVLLTACAGAPKVTIGPDHFYTRTMATPAPDLAGSYQLKGRFADTLSDGGSLVIEQGPAQGTVKSASIKVKRTTADGALQAVGLGTVVGDQLYVAWELGKPEKLARGPMMVELYVVDLKGAGFEGFVGSSSDSPFSGTYAGHTSPAKLAVGAEATYPMVQQAFHEPDRKYDLELRRYKDQLFSSVSTPSRSGAHGTALLAGDTRLAAAVVSEVMSDIPTLAIGVYTIASGSLSGRSVFMDNVKENNPPHGGMGGTLRLAPETEQWTRAGGDAKTPAPTPPPATTSSAP